MARTATAYACASLWIACSMTALAQGTDPSVEPLPDPGFANPGRALVVQVQLDGNGGAVALGSVVSAVPGRAHTGDPPLLRVTWRDAAGNMLGAHNAWDPRWEFEHTATGGERRNLLASIETGFDVPFSPAIASVTIRDLQAGQDLLTVDVSATVEAFCTSTPAACQQGIGEQIFADGFEAP